MADTMTPTVLPKELRMGVPAKMPQARSYMFRQQSSLPSYKYGETITINIPRLQRSYLRKDSYLRFRLNGHFTPTDSSQSLVLDTCGAFGLFEKLEVFDYLGSTVLESISGVPQLSSLLLDMGLKEVVDKNIGNQVAGLNTDYCYNGEPGLTFPVNGTSSAQTSNSCVNQSGYVYPPSSGIDLVPGTRIPSSEKSVMLQGLEDNTAVTVSALVGGVTTDFTFAAIHYLDTGAPVRFAAQTELLPSAQGSTPVDFGTQYYAIVVSTTVIKIASSYENANAGIPIVFTSTGTAVKIDKNNTTITDTAHGLQTNDRVWFSSKAINPSYIPTGIIEGKTYYVLKLTDNTYRLKLSPDSNAYINFGPNFVYGFYRHTSKATITSFTKEFAIPLPSFLGFLSQKMVPLHNGYTIVLTIANQTKPMYLSQPSDTVLSINYGDSNSIPRLPDASHATLESDVTRPEWNLSDVYMECQILELGPVAESMILSSTQGSPLVIHTKAFRNYVTTVKGATWNGNEVSSTGTQEFVLNMNLNVASLTNLLWFMRPTNQTDSILYPSCGSRTRNFLQRWQFQYGSTTLPQNNGIQTMAQTLPTYPSGAPSSNNTIKYRDYAFGSSESFHELIKSRPCFLPSNRFSFNNYNIDSCWNTNLDYSSSPIYLLNWKGIMPSAQGYLGLPRFAAGLNLQLVNGKDGDMISGLNTNGMNTSIRGMFHPMYINNMNNVTVDAFAEYDAFINISPGIATTVSF